MPIESCIYVLLPFMDEKSTVTDISDQNLLYYHPVLLGVDATRLFFHSPLSAVIHFSYFHIMPLASHPYFL